MAPLLQTTLQLLCKLQPKLSAVHLCYACQPKVTPNPRYTVDSDHEKSKRQITAIVRPLKANELQNTLSEAKYAVISPNKVKAAVSFKPETVGSQIPAASLNLSDEGTQARQWPAVFAALSKARLTGLVVSTALAGCALAAPTPFATATVFLSHPGTSLLGLCVGTGLTSAAANTVNQMMEIPYDSQMKRTQSRPLVRGLITPFQAGCFAFVSAVSGVGLLYATTNTLVACLGLGNMLLYTCIYTPLKRVSQLNTWVGSLVGAIPPLMGWATATGHLEWGSLILAALLFAWQFPHFMALSWNVRGDYARAGFVMTANVNPALAKRTSLRYAIVSGLVCLAGAGCSAVSLGPWAGWSLGLGTLPVNAALVYYAYKFYKASPDQSSSAARQLFRASLIHLPVCMTAMLICTHWTAIPVV